MNLTPMRKGDMGVLDIVAVSTGGNSANAHSCAIGTDRKVYCWGSNDSGQLGTGNLVASTLPIAVSTSGVLSGKDLIQVGTGGNFTYALDYLGSVYSWGRASNGRIGDGSTSRNVLNPVKINMTGVLSGLTIKQLAVENAHSCVIASNDRAYCWG